MLIQFRVGNYRSFGSEVTLSMEAVKAFKEHEENVIEADGYRLLRSAAIYGANASGKTNLGKALFFMQRFVLSSAGNNSVAEIATVPFKLNVQNIKKPSLFEVVFNSSEKTYRYGFEVTSEEVCSEWLFQSSGPRNKEFPLFIRDHDRIDVSDDFEEGKGREEETRNNALFLSIVDQKNGAVAHKIVKWFNDLRLFSGKRDDAYEHLTVKQMEDPITHRRLLEFVRQVDDSILAIAGRERVLSKDSISFSLPGMGKAVSGKVNYDFAMLRRQFDGDNPCGQVFFNLDADESAGTAKILRMAGLWLDILDNGAVAFVDELEAKLHPHLTRRLVRLFNSPETNPKNSQLIFVTHDTNMLTYGGLRRDQVWFCEKNRAGSTDLYSLAEIKVRKGARFENDYIGGKYGAIPYFGNVKDIGGEKE